MLTLVLQYRVCTAGFRYRQSPEHCVHPDAYLPNMVPTIPSDTLPEWAENMTDLLGGHVTWMPVGTPGPDIPGGFPAHLELDADAAPGDRTGHTPLPPSSTSVTTSGVKTTLMSAMSMNLHSVTPPNDRLDSATSAAPSTSPSTTVHTGNTSSLSSIAPTSIPNSTSSALCYLCDKAETSTPATSTQAPRPTSGLIPFHLGVASSPLIPSPPALPEPTSGLVPSHPGAAATLLLTKSLASLARLKPPHHFHLISPAPFQSSIF
ncbi:hypothetical protein B0H14DRAFT_3536767 [Mycena olivaceomarginata]|nr:hypothetical protein B0H14DRAFT_3536767 [Mycena olivaceomarginata]